MSVTTQRNFFVHNGAQFVSICDKLEIVGTESFKSQLWFMSPHSRSNYLAELLSCTADSNDPAIISQLYTAREDGSLVSDLNRSVAPDDRNSKKKFATSTQTVSAGLDEQLPQPRDNREAAERPTITTETQCIGTDIYSVPMISTGTQAVELDVTDQTAGSSGSYLDNAIPAISTTKETAEAGVVEKSDQLNTKKSSERLAITTESIDATETRGQQAHSSRDGNNSTSRFRGIWNSFRKSSSSNFEIGGKTLASSDDVEKVQEAPHTTASNGIIKQAAWNSADSATRATKENLSPWNETEIIEQAAWHAIDSATKLNLSPSSENGIERAPRHAPESVDGNNFLPSTPSSESDIFEEATCSSDHDLSKKTESVIVERAARPALKNVAKRNFPPSTPSSESDVFEEPACSTDHNLSKKTPTISFSATNVDERTSQSNQTHQKKVEHGGKSQLDITEECGDLIELGELRRAVELMKMRSEADELTIEKLRRDLADAINENRKCESARAKDASNRRNQELLAFEKESKYMCEISALKTELGDVLRHSQHVIDERNLIEQDYAQLSIHYSQFWNQHQNCNVAASGLDEVEFRRKLHELELRAQAAEDELNATRTRLAAIQNELTTANNTNDRYEKMMTSTPQSGGTGRQNSFTVTGTRNQSSSHSQPERQKSVLERLMSTMFAQMQEPTTTRAESNENVSIQLKNAIADRDKIVEDMMAIQTNLEIAEKKFEDAMREAKSAKDQAETLKDENELLKNEIAHLKSELVASVTQTKALEAQVVANGVAHVQAMAEKQTIIGDLTNCYESLRSKNEKTVSMEEQIVELKRSLSERETEISRMSESVTALNTTLEQKAIENENILESVRLMKKSNQGLLERSNSQIETMQSLHQSNETLSTMLNASKCKVQQLEKDLKQTVMDKNLLTEIKQENEKLRSDSKILKERIKKSKSNESVKAVRSISIRLVVALVVRYNIYLNFRTKSPLSSRKINICWHQSPKC